MIPTCPHAQLRRKTFTFLHVVSYVSVGKVSYEILLDFYILKTSENVYSSSVHLCRGPPGVEEASISVHQPPSASISLHQRPSASISVHQPPSAWCPNIINLHLTAVLLALRDPLLFHCVRMITLLKKQWHNKICSDSQLGLVVLPGFIKWLLQILKQRETNTDQTSARHLRADTK